MPVISCDVALGRAATQSEHLGELSARAKADRELLKSNLPAGVADALRHDASEAEAEIAGATYGTANVVNRALGVCGVTSIDPVTRAGLELGNARGMQNAFSGHAKALDRAGQFGGFLYRGAAQSYAARIPDLEKARDKAIARLAAAK